MIVFVSHQALPFLQKRRKMSNTPIQLTNHFVKRLAYLDSWKSQKENLLTKHILFFILSDFNFFDWCRSSQNFLLASFNIRRTKENIGKENTLINKARLNFPAFRWGGRRKMCQYCDTAFFFFGKVVLRFLWNVMMWGCLILHARRQFLRANIGKTEPTFVVAMAKYSGENVILQNTFKMFLFDRPKNYTVLFTFLQFSKRINLKKIGV